MKRGKKLLIDKKKKRGKKLKLFVPVFAIYYDKKKKEKNDLEMKDCLFHAYNKFACSKGNQRFMKAFELFCNFWRH